MTPDAEERGASGRDAETQARELIIRLVDFLKDYDAQRNPPVTDVDAYGLYQLRGEDVVDSPSVTVTGGADTWMRVAFTELPAQPAIPDALRDLLPASAMLSATRRPIPVLPGHDPDAALGPDEEPPLDEFSLRRLADAELWVEQTWAAWSTAYAQAQRAKEFYRKLFDQEQLISNNRETYEMVWGFGRVVWRDAATTVNHPLFAVTVDLEQSADNSLVVRPSGPLEVETLPFANMPVADRAALGRIREAQAIEPLDPWSHEVLTDEVRSVIRALHHDAVVVGEGQPQQQAPTADAGWLLFTRRKRPDRQGFLDAMRELYAGGVVPPDSLSSIVVDAPSAFEVEEEYDLSLRGPSTSTVTADPEPLLLPLPSNDEQQRILILAQRQSGVVVQGPPGTGKSHTIANLVSHYVAYGKRVLVVAEKEQALTVLAEKIPGEIRDLAVSVLGSDQSSRRELEVAITEIQARVSTLDRRYQDQLIVNLTEDLTSMDSRIATATDSLLRGRRSETIILPGDWPPGRDPSPERAAKWIADHEQRLAYITDPLTPDTRLPVTAAEFDELLRLIRTVGIDRAQRSAWVLPRLDALPAEADLTQMIALRAQMRSVLASAGDEVADWTAIDGMPPAAVDLLRESVAEELARVEAAQQPWLATLGSQMRDVLLRNEWQAFGVTIHREREIVMALRGQLSAHTIHVPEHADVAFRGRLEQARQRLIARGKLGPFANQLKQTLEQCVVDGSIPATADTVGLCQLQLQLMDSRRTLAVRWNNHVEPIGGPLLDGPRPEDGVGGLLARFDDVLLADQRWAGLQDRLGRMGITVHGPHRPATVARTLEVIDLIPARQRERSLDTELANLRAYLLDGSRRPNASPLWAQLADAVTAETPQTWQRHRDAVAELVEIAPAALRLTELAGRLESAAPLWTHQVLADPAEGHDPQDLAEAWAWRQLDTWVKAIIGGDSLAALQSELEQLGIDRRRLVAQLVGVRAWRRLADNLGDRQRQALNSYLAATKRYGKTGGKFAARWLTEIRAALDQSKDAVPVWIMTTNQALASFRPDERVPFDVIIIDEASQIGIDALPLLALADRAIVVGDDKQTSPGAVGVDQQKVFDLIDSHLERVRHSRVLFNPGNSIYDLAFQKFPRSVMLREHFRCLPEIIAFSNRSFYGDKIEPLREDRPSPGWTALGAIKVIDGYRDRSTDCNVAEANVVADTIAKMTDDPAYDGMDFGVVSLLSGAQSELIRTKLFERLGPNVMTERRIRVGDAANFQGDERDVMLICTVVATDPSDPTRRIGAMTSNDAAQRINVAASRAREKMILVHSVEPERFPAADLRAALIRHCRNPISLDIDLQDQIAQCDSDFERIVLRRILDRGYARVRSQVRVGSENHSYRIDLVVDGPESRIAVECDGERWHGEERWHADRARQEVLERAGWSFCRIRGSAFFRDPDAALEPLWARLEQAGIPTGDDWLTEPRMSTVVEVHGFDLRLDQKDTALVIPEAVDDSNAIDPTSTTAAGEPQDIDRQTLDTPPADNDVAGAIRTALGEPSAAASTQNSSHAATTPAHQPWSEKIDATTGAPANPEQPPVPYRVRSHVRLAPYRNFSGGPFVAVSMDHTNEIRHGIREIISVEGPIVALRAYQLYVQASGGQRAGTEIRRVLNHVVHNEIRRGALASLKDGTPGVIGRTIYLPGTPPVVVRALGARELIEVPKSEVRTLITELDLAGHSSASVSRAVLETYGLSRLGARAREFLDECQTYVWQL